MNSLKLAIWRNYIIATAILTTGLHLLIWGIGAFMAWDSTWLGWTGHRILFVLCLLTALGSVLSDGDEDDSEDDQ